ncbi:hypothetical protein [Streptomyces sp. NPDC088785]|uniref:hypothetical protein n=1 Tax=Streptomyces sp. NPDC088785 TaxID=3365897 RepID=UPI003824B67C
MSSRSADTLRSRYTEQAASDLADNRRRQQEIADQLAALKQQEALLADILDLAERYEEFDAAARTAERAREEAGDSAKAAGRTAPPARKTPAGRTPAQRTPGGKAPGKPSAQAVGNTRAKGDPKKSDAEKGDAEKSGTKKGVVKRSAAKGAPRRPLLRDLLVDLLAAHDAPRSAAELREELLSRYPDRTPTPQVVRNTLEALVAKSRIRRHKEQRSVTYTVVRPAD